MKKSLQFMAVLVMVIVALAACGNSGDKKKESSPKEDMKMQNDKMMDDKKSEMKDDKMMDDKKSEMKDDKMMDDKKSEMKDDKMMDDKKSEMKDDKMMDDKKSEMKDDKMMDDKHGMKDDKMMDDKKSEMKDDKMMNDKHGMKDDKMMDDKKSEMKDDKMMNDKHGMKDDKMMDDKKSEMKDDKMMNDKKSVMKDDKMMNEEKKNDGEMAMDFALMDKDGKEFSLSGAKGEKVYVKFWASWCSICLAGLEELNTLAAKDNDFTIVTIVSPNVRGEKSKEDFIKWFDTLGYDNVRVLFDEDGKVAENYGVRAFPTSVLVGSDGVLISTRPGHMSAEAVEKAFTEIK